MASSSSINDMPYESWKLKFPSALEFLNNILKDSKSNKIVLFLDYDGTLSPIVKDPERAIMSPEMQSALKEVSKHFTTSIISGRSREKVQEFVRLPQLYYAGSHGMDIMGPVRSADQEVSLYQPETATDILRIINMAFRALIESTKHIKGAKVEDNKFCLSVHYRNVDTESVEAVRNCVKDIIRTYPTLKSTDGLKVFEIRPKINWNKGNAVEHLLGIFGADVLPIYIGDDRTDEDAFKILKKLRRGYGIVVSTVPKESVADYSLRNPLEVRVFLESLVTWKNLV